MVSIYIIFHLEHPIIIITFIAGGELITRGDRSIHPTTNRGTHVFGALRYTHGHQESHIKGRAPVGIKVSY